MVGKHAWSAHPTDLCTGSSSVGMDIALVGFEFVYGLPEHADSLALKSTL